MGKTSSIIKCWIKRIEETRITKNEKQNTKNRTTKSIKYNQKVMEIKGRIE